MTDFFALLEEPRRPWLDPEALKLKFLALSVSIHPDRIHTASAAEKTSAAQNYTQLNSAYNCLRDPKKRLAHFLQLELREKPRGLHEMPAELAELFLEVAQLCRQVDEFLTEKARITSSLLQVQLFKRGQEWIEKLNALLGKLTTRRETVIEQLKILDADWGTVNTSSNARVETLRQLDEIYQLLSFFGRWMEQVQARLTQLNL